MALRIDILTLFPEMFTAVLGTSIPKRAAEKGLVSYNFTNIRSFATDAHKSVDGKPFGGGPGMVMMCETVYQAVAHAQQQDPRPATRILLSPQGRLFDQRMAEQFATRDRLLFIAGRYEGFDERIIDGLAPMEEVSIGDYVLSGGELAAMVIIDAVVRLLPGALGAETGASDETFADGLLEYPQYTQPREYNGMKVPDVLLSGNHAAIAKWRLEQRKLRTQHRRPDLWEAYVKKQERKS
ncbi:MAG TPA: tRNA (guanosine(37)-N1)-methyltransferase TrmD [Tepidisphaeraceae bacterium]|jgi:tRNA (guanine37-N1)-methyltransferase